MTTFFPIEEGLQQEQQELSDMAKVGDRLGCKSHQIEQLPPYHLREEPKGRY
jgi:hypothetical protein